MSQTNENSLQMSGLGKLFAFKNGGEKLFVFNKTKSGNEQLFNFKAQPKSDKDSIGKLFNFSKAKSDVFNNVFTETPKEEKNDGTSDVMDNIIKSEETEETKSLLGPLPKIDTSLFIDEEYHARKKFSFSRGLFATASLVAMFALGYFYIQLSPTFDVFSGYLGQNVEQSLHAKTGQLQNLQTELNAERYRIVKAHLDNFTYYADEFLKRYNESLTTKDDAKKSELSIKLSDLRKKLKEDFEVIKQTISKSNYIATYREEEISSEGAIEEFNDLLKEYFRKERVDILAKESDIAKSKAKEISEIIALIGNKKFEHIFAKYEFDSLTNESIKALISEINGVVKNELSILHIIMDQKINWADIIHEIENITIQVDDLYGSGYFEELGGINYTSYDFDASSNRVSITGQTKRDDATNFTLIADLIDKLEQSSIFKDVNMKSFTKSGSLESGYVATLKLDFFLQGNDEESGLDKKADPKELPNISETKGVKKS